MTFADWMTLFSSVGDLLVGIAAVGVVIAGLHQTRTELEKRRTEREDARQDAKEARDADRDQLRRAKRADVAGELAIAAQRFLVSMQVVSDAFLPQSISGPSGRAEADAVRAAFQLRWDEANAGLKVFLDAWMMAKIHLPPAVDALCEEIWFFRIQTLNAQKQWLGARGTKMERAAQPFAVQSVGVVPFQRAEALSKKVLEVLRPFTQYDSPPEPGSATRLPPNTRVDVALNEPAEEEFAAGSPAATDAKATTSA